DLKYSPSGGDDLGDRSPLFHARREGLYHEAVHPRPEDLRGQGQVAVRGRHHVDRVDMGKGGSIVADHTVRSCAGLHREAPALLGYVRDPDLRTQLGEHAEVLLAPPTEPDQEDLHRPRSPSPPTCSATS